MRSLLFILAIFFFVDASRSQVIDGVEIVRPRIITGEWDSVTKKFPVAVEFTIAKGWHMYWLNPGDAGSPPEVKWALPMDWQIGKLQFPVPVHEVEDGFESYAYYDKLVLYSEITSPRVPLPNDQIEAGISWMVCKDICVAGKQQIKWPYEMTNIYHEWPKLPLVITLAEAGYQWAVSGDAIMVPHFGTYANIIEVTSPDGQQAKVADFFPIVNSHLPLFARAQEGVIEVGGKLNSQLAPIEALNGLVFIGDKVYWLKAP